MAPVPVPSVDQAPLGDRDIDLRYYAGLVWRHRSLLGACALVGLLLGLVVALVQTPEYKAAVLLQIEPPPPTFATVSDALLMGAGNYWQNTDFYNTQFRVLRSKGLGEKVVARLKLTDREPFKSSAAASALFMAQVGVEPVPESRLAFVSVTHRDPREAALWANTLAEVYIEQSLASRVDSARKAYEWLQERLTATQQGMKDAQDKLFQSYRSQDLFVPEGSVSAVSSSIARLNEDFIQAQARRIAIEAALKQAREMQARGEELDALPQVATDPAVAAFNTQLAALTVELGRLGEKFKEGHPEVQKVKAQAEQLRKAKQARAAQILDGLDAEYTQLRKREAELRGAIDSQKTQAANQSRKATELEALRKESDSAKGLYEVLLQKLNETDIAASIRSNNVSIVDRASPPSDPVRPQKRQSALAGMLLGLIAGLGLVLGRDFLGNTIRDPEEIERYLHLDLLAAVPRYAEENDSLATEAYQNLRTALLFARGEEGGQVVLVTGTAPQEGKTTTIVNLARLLAASGEKTVVVDCDLRRAQMHQRLGLPREPGFTDFFVRHEPLSALLRPTPLANLFALTAGPLPPNPPALLARKALGTLFADLKSEFEWVLIDSPPLASVTDALLLARHADHTVLVIQHNNVDKKLVKRSVAALRKATPGLLGAVLNVVDVRARSYQYYYYPQKDAPTPAGSKPAGRGRREGREAPGPDGGLSGMLGRATRFLTAVLALALAAGAHASAQAPAPAAPPAPPRPPGAGIAIGDLGWAARDVERAELPQKSSWRRLTVGDKLRTGDTFRTSEDATARLDFPWMAVTLGSSTMLTIPSSTVLSTVLEQGRAEFAGPGRDIVKIRVGEGEVRGGGRLVLRRSVGRTSATALEGAFHVRAAGRTVEIKGGEGTVVTDGRPPETPGPLPAAPRGLHPGKDPVYVRVGQSVDLRWPAGSPSYRVEILALQADEVLLARDVAAPPLRVEVPWLGTYRWRVSTRDARGLESPPRREGLICAVER